MDGENVKVRDRVELALDGRQIASIVVGSLVLLGVVFVVGLNVGKQTAVKQIEASRGDALAALDAPPPAAPVASDSLTFHDKLTRDRNAPVEPGPSAAPEARPEPRAEPAVAKAEPRTEPKAEPAKAAPKAEAKAEPRAEAKVAKAEAPAKSAFVVQVVATPSRSEADRLAGKLKDYSARVEESDVPGKGRLYRVRVGGFATKAEAEKFLKGFNGKTGSKGLVVASR